MTIYCETFDLQIEPHQISQNIGSLDWIPSSRGNMDYKSMDPMEMTYVMSCRKKNPDVMEKAKGTGKQVKQTWRCEIGVVGEYY